MKVKVINRLGEEVGEVELSDVVFGARVNEGLVHRAVVRYLHNQRQGTSATKTRAMVRGGGRKPWRQKGTGRARQGSIRSPLWRKGGVVFGPHPRDYSQEMPKKMRRAALRSALSARAQEEQIVVLDNLHFEKPATKEMAAMLKRLGSPNALIVVGGLQPAAVLSVRNLPRAEVVTAKDINVYQVVRHERLILVRDAIEPVQEVLG